MGEELQQGDQADQARGPEGWVPAFPGQRPPFEEGNTVGRRFGPGHEVSVKHGAYSPRHVEPAAEELRQAILSDPAMPAHLRSPINGLELAAMCRAHVQAELAAKSLGECVDRCDGDLVKAATVDGFMPAALLLHRAEQRASAARSRLGLNSSAAARLGKHVSQGQAAQADVALRMAQLHDLEKQGWTPPPGWGDAAGGGGS